MVLHVSKVGDRGGGHPSFAEGGVGEGMILYPFFFVVTHMVTASVTAWDTVLAVNRRDDARPMTWRTSSLTTVCVL